MHVGRHLRLGPRDPLQLRCHRTQIGVSYYFERDYLTALEAAKAAVSRHPEVPLTYRYLAAALGQLGRTEEAPRALQQARSISPASFNFMSVPARPGSGQRTTSTCSRPA